MHGRRQAVASGKRGAWLTQVRVVVQLAFGPCVDALQRMHTRTRMQATGQKHKYTYHRDGGGALVLDHERVGGWVVPRVVTQLDS